MEGVEPAPGGDTVVVVPEVCGGEGQVLLEVWEGTQRETWFLQTQNKQLHTLASPQANLKTVLPSLPRLNPKPSFSPPPVPHHP